MSGLRSIAPGAYATRAAALSFQIALALVGALAMLFPRADRPFVLFATGGNATSALVEIISDPDARVVGLSDVSRSPIVVTDEIDPIDLLLTHGVLAIAASAGGCATTKGSGA